MNNNPTVSVIMSVRNAGPWLEDSLQSILSQTFKNFEFLIVDDNSNDRSAEILKKFESSDDRIKVYFNNNLKGLPANLNFLIKQAKGSFIARMDADDISHQTRLENQLKFMEDNKDIGLCFSNANIIINDGSFLCKKWSPNNIWTYHFMLPYINYFTHPTAFVRKKVYLDDGLYNEKFLQGQDWKLWQSLHRKGIKFGVVKKILLDYRLNIASNSASLSSSSKHGLNYFKAIVLIRNRKKLSSLKLINKIPKKLLFTYGLNLFMPQLIMQLALIINSKFNKNSAANKLLKQDI